MYVALPFTIIVRGPQDAGSLNQARRAGLFGGRVRDGSGLRALQPRHGSESLAAHWPCVCVCACLLVIYAHVYVLCEALQAYRRRTSSKKFVVPGSVKGLIGSTAFGGRPPSQMNGSTLRQRKGASATD